MVFNFSFHFILTAFALLVNIILIFLVYRQKKDALVNRFFVVLCLLLSAWLTVLYADSLVGPNIWLARISILSGTLVSLFFYFLAKVLPDGDFSISRIKIFILVGLTVITSAICLSPLGFKDVIIENGVKTVTPGIGMPIFIVFTTWLCLLAVYILVRKIKRTQGIQRQQLRFVMGGIALMLTLVILTIPLPIYLFHDMQFVAWASVYVLVFLIMTALAILRYHLFDVKLIAIEFLVGTLILVLFVEGLLSNSTLQIIYKICFAILIGILGTFLARSVEKEHKQKEELKDLAHSFEKANIRLQELDKQKTEFLSIAAHQLRTPLSIIKGYVELVKEGAYGKTNQKTNAVLSNVENTNEHLVKLVDEFLDISRIEQGRTKYNFESSNICETVTSVVEEMKMRAEEKALSIFWSSCHLPAVIMDAEKVRHVVFNFVDNAIKYSESGKIEIVTEDEGDGVAVRVRDSGIGFEKNDQANFYQKFYRGDNVKGTNVNGTGLGLYVCRKFIEAHGGKVWAHSEGLKKGSEFGFWLPFKPVPQETPTVPVAV